MHMFYYHVHRHQIYQMKVFMSSVSFFFFLGNFQNQSEITIRNNNNKKNWLFMLLPIKYFWFTVIGGWVNSRVLIRRKKSDQVLQQVFVTPILSAQTPIKFIIEVANSKFASKPKLLFFFFFSKNSTNSIIGFSLNRWFCSNFL